jgi:hypothetical protein
MVVQHSKGGCSNDSLCRRMSLSCAICLCFRRLLNVSHIFLSALLTSRECGSDMKSQLVVTSNLVGICGTQGSLGVARGQRDGLSC